MSARCARQPEGGNSLLPHWHGGQAPARMGYRMLQPRAKQGPSPASGLNAYMKPIDSSVLALHLAWYENKPSARVWLGRRRTHQRKVMHTQRQEAWKKETVNSACCSRTRSGHCQDSNGGNRLQQTLKPVQPRRKSMEAPQKAPASLSFTTAGT